MPRHIKRRVGIIALNLFFRISLVENKFHSGFLGKWTCIRRTTIFMITGWSRTVDSVFRYLAALHSSGVCKGLIAGVVITVSCIDCSKHLLRCKVLVLLAQRDRARISFFQAGGLPKRISVIHAYVNMRIAWIGTDERVSCLWVIAVVVRNFFKFVTVAERNISAVAILKSQSVELINGDVQIHAAELFLVNDRERARRFLFAGTLLRCLLLLLLSRWSSTTATSDERKAQDQTWQNT